MRSGLRGLVVAAGIVDGTPVASSLSTGADLPSVAVRKRTIALVFGIAFVLYVSLVPRFVLYASPPTGDQPFYLMDTLSLVQDGDLNLRNNFDQRDEDKFYSRAPHPDGFVGMNAPYPLPAMNAHAVARPASEVYHFHPPGLGALLVPAWVVGSWFSLWWPATIVFMCLIGALVALNGFLLAHAVSGRLGIAWAVWLPIAFSNPVMSYSYLIFTELPTGLLVVYPFRRLALGWRANGRVRLLLTGLAIGYLPWLAPRATTLAAALAFYAVVQWRRGGSELGVLAWLFAPLALSIPLLGYYHWFLYGTPLPLGDLTAPLGAGERTFHWPWLSLYELGRFLDGAFGLLFDRSFGLLIYAPVYALAVPGLIALVAWGRKSDRRLVIWLAAVALPYLFVIAAFEHWSGVWSPPARYLTTFAPLLAAPLAASIALGGKVYRALYALLVAPGFILMAILMYDARLMFPIDGVVQAAVFRWLATTPALPFHVDVRALVPSFVAPDEARNAALSGCVLAVFSVIALVGTSLLAWESGRLSRRRVQPRSVLTVSASLGVTAVLLGSSWFAVNRELLQPHATLTLEQVWFVPLGPPEKEVLAYARGRVYFTRRDEDSSRALFAMDTTTGHMTKLPLRIPLVHPTAVTADPNGLLYILDNRARDYVVYAVNDDGSVAWRSTLEPGAGAATDLAIGANRLYVSMPGEVRVYRPGGGGAIDVWHGETGSFNNAWSVALDDRGHVFVAEATGRRVQELAANGRFIRSFRLHECHPFDVSYRDGWLAVGCEERNLFLDTRTQTIRRTLVRGPNSNFSTGALAYVSGDRLAVLQPGELHVYRFKHP